MSMTLPKFDDTYGVAFIGALVSVMLYGLTTLQTYFYFVSYPKDTKANKSLVSLIWILDTVQTMLVSWSMYYYLVTNFGNPSALDIGHWSLFASLAVNLMISCFVQCFFTLQIFRLSPLKIRWRLCSCIAFIVIGHFCFGMGTVVLLFIKKELKSTSQITFTVLALFVIFAILSDIIIAVSLCILLHNSRKGLRRTNTLLNTLIVYAINRCLLTSIVAVAEVIAYAVAPHSLWFQGLDFFIGKLYANSLLATLNSRKALRGETGSTSNSAPLSIIGFREEMEREDATRGGIVISLDHEEPCSTSANDHADAVSSKRQSAHLDDVLWIVG